MPRKIKTKIAQGATIPTLTPLGHANLHGTDGGNGSKSLEESTQGVIVCLLVLNVVHGASMAVGVLDVSKRNRSKFA